MSWLEEHTFRPLPHLLTCVARSSSPLPRHHRSSTWHSRLSLCRLLCSFHSLVECCYPALFQYLGLPCGPPWSHKTPGPRQIPSTNIGNQHRHAPSFVTACEPCNSHYPSHRLGATLKDLSALEHRVLAAALGRLLVIFPQPLHPNFDFHICLGSGHFHESPLHTFELRIPLLAPAPTSPPSSSSAPSSSHGNRLVTRLLLDL